MDRETALAEFDTARDSFVTAFEAAPGESLTFLRAGDIYAIGGLAVHCNWVLKHYRRVLEELAETNEGGFRAADPPGENEEANRRALAGLAPHERSAELAELDSLHEAVRRAAQRLSAGAWEEKTPVFYGDATEAYPTSPDDVIGWLRDHYQEHVPHAGELLAEWRASHVAP
jgi:DinB superfamily